MSVRSLPVRAVVLAAAFAFPNSASAQSKVPLQPAADHHAHLQSRAVWPLFHPELPVIQVPADLDRLLRAFENGWQASDNKLVLSSLFTADGVLQWADDWVQGPAAIRVVLLGEGGGRRLRPQVFETNGPLGYVAGAFGLVRDTTWVDQGRFVLTLRMVTDAWRISAAIFRRTTPPTRPDDDPFSAADLIAQLDSAGIGRATVLSLAYQFGASYRQISDEQTKVQAENDWVAEQVARYPDRLVGFCSVNPLRSYALDELQRCVRHPHLSGLKLHFTTSGVDLRNRGHVERLRGVFRMANDRRFPVVVHMRTLSPAYGRTDAEIFLRDVLAEAPDIPVQIAHLAGWGGYGDETDQALEVFASAADAGDRRVANLYFDLSQVVYAGMPERRRTLLVERVRRIGVQRLLFGVDGADTPAKVWADLQQLPLEGTELRTIAGNLAPWMR
jgi:predicted TIM-barrel fold metal-dependent hydrolase